MSIRAHIPGKFVWYEHVSKDAKKAQAFYREVLGWQVEPFPIGGETYEMIQGGGTTVGGYTQSSAGQLSHWISYVSVEDVDAAAKATAANGGKIVDAPYDVPGIGRMARLADPQGAEFCLFRSNDGDMPDEQATQGRFLWNELNTPDSAKALTFYETVAGFKHHSMDMGHGELYHIVGRGGVDRGGVTTHITSGMGPHWLPYVYVDEVDATVARAKNAGGTIKQEPVDIPGVGRFAVVQDPTGAVLAVMKPKPM